MDKNTASTDKTSGTLVVTGGVGVSGQVTPATPAHHIFHLLLVCMSYLQTATLELLPPLPLLPLLPLDQRRIATVPVPVVFVVTEINLDSKSHFLEENQNMGIDL